MSASGLHSTPRKQATPSTPRTGTTITQEQQRNSILEATKNELIQCCENDWLHTYAPRAGKWPETFVSSILQHLRQGPLPTEAPSFERHLDQDGWIAINSAIKAGHDENQTFSAFQRIASSITSLAITINTGLKENFTCVTSPHSSTYSNVPGYLFKSDLRMVRSDLDRVDGLQYILRKTNAGKNLPPTPRRSCRLSDNAASNDDAGCRKVSDETSDTATIGEFKLKNNPHAKRDVCITSLTSFVLTIAEVPHP